MRRMLRTLALVAAAQVLSGALHPAHAQIADNVGLIVKISADPSIGGSAIGGASGAINGVPVSVLDSPWADTHSQAAPLFEAGVGVRAAEWVEVLGLVNYGRAGASADTIGEIGGTPIDASFDDYKFWGLEGGLRVRPPSGVGPYGTFTAGFRHVGDLNVRLVAGSTVRAVSGYEASTVPSFAAGGGMLWGDAGFAMGIEVAIRYAGAPAAAGTVNVTPASDAGARWSLPIGIVVRF